MVGIELSSLSGQEIRRLLAAAEQREQRDLAERLRAELAARSHRGAMTVGPQMRASATPPPFVARFETAEDSDGALDSLKPTLLVVAAVAAVAIGIGWTLSQAPSQPAAPQAAVTAPILPAPVAAPVAAPLVAPAPAPAQQVVVEPPPALAPQVVAQPPAPAPVAKPAKVVKAKAAPPRAAACRSNRMVCSSPQLMAQDQRMRRAYDQALAAGADPLAVDEEQARWRTALAQTGSHTGAAQLYDRRIRELEATARPVSRQ